MSNLEHVDQTPPLKISGLFEVICFPLTIRGFSQPIARLSVSIIVFELAKMNYPLSAIFLDSSNWN